MLATSALSVLRGPLMMAELGWRRVSGFSVGERYVTTQQNRRIAYSCRGPTAMVGFHGRRSRDPPEFAEDVTDLNLAREERVEWSRALLCRWTRASD